MKLARLVGAGVLATVTGLTWAQAPAPVPSEEPSQPRSQPQAQPGSIPAALPTPDGTQTKHDVDEVRTRDISCNLLTGGWYTLERQISIGRSVAQQIDSQVRFVNDPVVVEYVNRVGQSLARSSNALVPFTIKVIDSDAVNALSVPGGFLYINSGLILAADEEAELAGAMAHEIAHVAMCHAGRQWRTTEAPGVPWGTVTLGAGGVDDVAGMYGIARFPRGFEAEADYLGIQYMYRAGYDPHALVLFFEKIHRMEEPPWKPEAVAKSFVTHPQNPDRVEKSQKEISSILPTRPEYLITSSEFDRVKARLAANRPTLKRRDDSNN